MTLSTGPVETMAPDRATALDRYRAVRSFTEQLSAPLCPEDQVVQSMPDVSPTKWHRAHTTWFFETFCCEPHLPGYEPVDAMYRVLFNSYYQQIGDQYPRPRRGVISRPDVAEVGHYRRHVDAAVDRLADTCAQDTWRAVQARIELGLHHEQQHQELLLMDIKHVLSCNPLDPPYLDRREPAPGGPATPLDFTEFEGGMAAIGHDTDDFAFDSEQPRHRVHLEPFRIANRLVTAGEWLEFIAAGGYESADLWLSDGWIAVQQQAWRAPLYWRAEDDGSWTHFTLTGRRLVDPAEPVVHVSHYEADAFARWAGARLPTEFEWEHAASSIHAGASPGTTLAPSGPGDAALHPQPARIIGSIEQLLGDVWEWTASAYLPYPGFVASPGAIGEYNGKFMSGQMVLRGGSCATPPSHTRPTYRNFFPPSSRWMFGGVRLASST